MFRSHQFSRRDVLKLGFAGSAALVLPLERTARTHELISDRLPDSKLPAPFNTPFVMPPVAQPVKVTATADIFDITMKSFRAEVIPGYQTELWGYNGSFPGPTINARRGRETIVRHTNALPGVHPDLRYKPWTSVHLHGSASLPQYDGYASDITNPGEYKDYRYPNIQDSRTLWYHDHGVHHTSSNVYMGLAGVYQLHDDLEDSLPIPKGRYDIPLVISDAIFANDGSLVFDTNGDSSFYGDVILTNGRPWPVMKVERRKYRFRILNCSISRSYRFALSTGDPFTVIGNDGGLMPAPQQVTQFKHAMAERYEVVIDFSKYQVGQRVVLKNLSNPNNQDFDTTGNVMAFDIAGDATDTTNNMVPAQLNPNQEVMGLKESDAIRTRQFRFERSGGQWTINGKTWQDVVDSDYTFLSASPGLGDTEIWEFQNTSGGWFHPIHVHLVDFKVLDRTVSSGRGSSVPSPPFAYEKGPKDVVYLGENETVRVIAKFGPQRGRYMMHCHNLVHEDHDMMVQFEVGTGGDDPIKAAPAKPLPAPPF